ncbi:MAG: hypothetical protein EXR07_21155 [Acetobacteraceae bacterium]|nr:hypothetical protein [Acetobacteraceae bacterium]
MSDAREDTACFLALYDQGRVDDAALDDFVEAWHESGDEEQRSLAEFLGMTDTEYAVIGMAPGALGLIVRARREKRSLRALLTPYLASLREANDPQDRSTIHALGHWLNKPEAP